MNCSAAKEEERANDQMIESWNLGGVAYFVQGKFKPGLEGHESIKR